MPSRWDVPTPALLVDLDVLEANVARAAALAAEAGVALRPHAKTHKCAAIARLQLEAGAVGLCTAKVGEAEALVAAGVRPVGGYLVTTPVHAGLRSRLGTLAESLDGGLAVVVDHPEQLAAVRDLPVRVLVDLDVGLHRTGVPTAEGAAALATQVASTPGVTFGGVQAYGGHWQHLDDPMARRDAVAEGMAFVADAVAAIEAVGLAVGVRTGGGTGTLTADLALGVLDELQLGSYALMDREYRDALAGDPGPGWGQALWVQATVVSANHDGFVTLDAGTKAFATDAGAPSWPGGDGRYAFFGDEHGLLTTSGAEGDASPLRLGDRVELVPPHCDPTVDRYDVLHLVRGDEVVDVVPVDARGRSQ